MFDHIGDPADHLPEQLFYLPRSTTGPQPSDCPLPDRLPGELLALLAARCEQFIRYAELHLGSRKHAVRVVDELLYELATCWDLALKQPSVDAYIWTVFKEILDDHLDARDALSSWNSTSACSAPSPPCPSGSSTPSCSPTSSAAAPATPQG